MISVEEARSRILGAIQILGAEKVDLLSALGRVLAEPIFSRRTVPPWDNSSMDGYAVRSADIQGASREQPRSLEVIGHIPAGSVAEGPLGPGQAYRIMTGAPVPPGADAVIPLEDSSPVSERGVSFSCPVSPGENVRARGEDIREGDLVLAPGDALRPADIGLLASLGRSWVEVIQRPRVAILSSGDEIVDIDGELAPGKVANSNTYSLMAQVMEAGGIPMNLGIARDSKESIEERVRWGFGADLLLSSGGVSVGDYDLVKDVLKGMGAELHLWLVNMRPGKPLTFGTLGSKPIFGLPGNPVSSMVTFEIFVRPSLLKMAGHRQIFRQKVKGIAVEPIPNPGQRWGYLRVRVTATGEGYTVRLTGAQGSAILRSMSLANGLAVVPPDTTVKAGEPVQVILLDPSAEPRSL